MIKTILASLIMVIGLYDTSLAQNTINYNHIYDTNLVSPETSIDYQDLNELLKKNKWQEADQKTRELMNIRPSFSFNDSDYLKPFPIPCTDLKIIDYLWSKYSAGKFGFRSQKLVYLSFNPYIFQIDTSILENQSYSPLSSKFANLSEFQEFQNKLEDFNKEQNNALFNFIINIGI